MIPPSSASGAALSPEIGAAVLASLEKTHGAFFREMPTFDPNPTTHSEGPCIAGIIAFLGDVSFTFSWILASPTACLLANRFTGFDIPFESPDMGDLAGELVNVIAGEIISQLEQRRIKATMSLPTAARGNPLELIPEAGPAIANYRFVSKEGPFWFRIASAKHFSPRTPGK